MSFDVHSDFDLDQKIKIVPLNYLKGRIIGIYYSHYGIKYYVSYYIDFERKENYFFPDEIKIID